MDSPEEKSGKVLRRVFNKFDASGGASCSGRSCSKFYRSWICRKPAFCEQDPGMRESLAKDLDMMETGIILWNDFNMKMVDVLVNSVDIVEKYSSVEPTTALMRLAGRVQHVHLSMMAPATICAMCGSPKPALPAVTFESSRGGETETDLKRVKKARGQKGDSKPKSENHSISDFDGFQLYHYNGLTGLKGVERGVVLKCTVYKRVDIVGLSSGIQAGHEQKPIDEVIRTKFKVVKLNGMVVSSAYKWVTTCIYIYCIIYIKADVLQRTTTTISIKGGVHVIDIIHLHSVSLLVKT